jgi:hypothetical protein
MHDLIYMNIRVAPLATHRYGWKNMLNNNQYLQNLFKTH